MANTISDKLTYLEGTKSAIKDAIISKGVAVSDSDTFRSYADKIEQIESGGGKADANNNWVNFNDVSGVQQSDIDSVDFSNLTYVDSSKRKFYNTYFLGNVSIPISGLTNAAYLFYGSKQNAGSTFTLNDNIFINTFDLSSAFYNAQLIEHYTFQSPVCTNYNNMFRSGSSSTSYIKLVSFDVDTAAGKRFDYMFYGSSLTDCKINLSNAIDIGTGSTNSIFVRCYSLANLSFYGTIPALNFYLSDCRVLSSQSVDNILNAIVDLTGETTKTITFNSAVYSALTEEQKSLAASKN
jgi:hypothetical protein